MTRVHLTLVSRNMKTGPIPVSTTTAETCPDNCPFKAKGCYAKGGPLAIHWRKVTEGKSGMDWDTFCETIATKLPKGQLWRMNQAGDLPGENNNLDTIALGQLVQANKGKRGFTYTHKPLDTYDERLAIKRANSQGFTVNLSANSPSHADALADLDLGPVVTVLPQEQVENSTTPAGRKIVVCPATIRDNVSCATCGLCQKVNRDCIVGFPAHGNGRKAASAIASDT